MKRKLLIAITGGIGSGKSTVSSIVENQGFIVLKADIIAKEIMINYKSVRQKIIDYFGKESYINGQLNTKFLAEKIFASKENVEKINSIVHPPTIQRVLNLAKEHFKKNDLVFVESALVYEAKIQNYFDYIILVYSDEKTRIERIMQRDNVDEEKIRQRMQYQIPDEKKRVLADFIVENNCDINELRNRILFLISLIKSL
ncbi:MAG: dephospho-CoA kinase [Melioribacter sp.]|nr:dephospho-CoA kinase [Melioribacter sp.]